MARAQKASVRYPKGLATTAGSVHREWSKDKFPMTDLTVEDYGKQVEQFATLESTIAELEAKLGKALDDRDRLGNGLWDTTRKVRNAAKGHFGDDSDEVKRYGVKPVRRGPRRPAAPGGPREEAPK